MKLHIIYNSNVYEIDPNIYEQYLRTYDSSKNFIDDNIHNDNRRNAYKYHLHVLFDDTLVIKSKLLGPVTYSFGTMIIQKQPLYVNYKKQFYSFIDTIQDPDSRNFLGLD